MTPEAPGPCSDLRVVALRLAQPDRASARALSLLQAPVSFDEETTLEAPGGIQIRYTTGINDFDRVATTDADGDGVADRVQAVLRGLEQARGLLVGQLGLPSPARLEVVLTNLKDGLHGIVVPPAVAAQLSKPAGRLTLLLDAGPDGDLDTMRRAAMQAYAHAVAWTAHSRFPIPWSDALARWSNLSVDGGANASAAACLSNRVAKLNQGLLKSGRDLGPGNALWFAFLEEAYDLSAVKATVEELAGTGTVAAALDRAMVRATGDSLTAGLREFHVWTVLVGERADSHHFSFASSLTAPEFASSPRGTPALSVQSDPAVGPTGATQVAIQPTRDAGGLRILFEGEYHAGFFGWAIDLILLRDDGTKHRLPVDLTEGRGEKTVPLDGLSQAWMLIRNLDQSDSTPRRYSYSAHHEKGFPFELANLQATDVNDDASRAAGIMVAWGTAAEHDMFGFNIVRQRESGGQPVIVNPIWIPAMGDAAESTAYHFIDRSAEPGVSYTYKIQGITRDGLTSQSDAVAVDGSSARGSR